MLTRGGSPDKTEVSGSNPEWPTSFIATVTAKTLAMAITPRGTW
ncbi:hypothetical protein ES703_33510 [subsurface metagenome]